MYALPCASAIFLYFLYFLFLSFLSFTHSSKIIRASPTPDVAFGNNGLYMNGEVVEVTEEEKVKELNGTLGGEEIPMQDLSEKTCKTQFPWDVHVYLIDIHVVHMCMYMYIKLQVHHTCALKCSYMYVYFSHLQWQIA